MKRITLILAAIIMACGYIKAQPAAVKNAAKSVFTVTTFKADGSLLASSHGVFVGSNGEAIGSLKPFIGAARATVIDSKGNKMEVKRIMGMNDIYDVIHFTVSGSTTPARLAASPLAGGGEAWLVPYPAKGSQAKAAKVKSVETFMDKYTYYIFPLNAESNTEACPFVNSKGEVIGLMQPSATTTDTHATDARFITSLVTNGLSGTSTMFRKIGIPAALPAAKDQAIVALMMANESGDSLKNVAAIADFTQAFPNLIDGYMAQAQLDAANARFNDAAACMDKALKNVEAKDEAHFNYSKLIYNKEIYQSNIAYQPWNLDLALNHAKQAYSIKPQPIYQHLEAQIIFAQGKYQEAYDMFTALTKTAINNPELLYEAARCKQMMKAPGQEIVALLDSAINTTDTMRITEAAPYFLLRAQIHSEMNNHRESVFDYTRYEILSNGNVNAEFYYIREQEEIKARLYQQALGDIARAIILSPEEPMYQAEMASLQLRVNRVDDAIKTGEHCVKQFPEYAEGYLLLGLAQVKKGNKADGMANLNKAKELGSDQAQPLIEKYK